MGHIVFAIISFAMAAALFYERKRQLRYLQGDMVPFVETFRRYLKIGGICAVGSGLLALASLFAS